MNLRVLHLTVARELNSGQIKQLHYEYESAKALQGCAWSTIAYQDEKTLQPFAHTIPLIFRGQFRRKLFSWLVALRLSKNYDYILMRHITFDPFSIIFSPLVANRCSVHHAKEVEELRLVKNDFRGILASWTEAIFARFSASFAKAIFGVTLEIAEYQRFKYSPQKPICRYSNGILSSKIPVLEDRRSLDSINIAFICSFYSAWHGLDRILEACLVAADSSEILTINLIGSLSVELASFISANNFPNAEFIIHGHMNQIKYTSILETCDYGIASFALHRQNLTEGSTLKVREMLAFGLPVYSGHEDIALPVNSNHVLISQKPSINEMIEFGWHCKTIDRQEVRSRSIPLIDKLASINEVVSFLMKTNTPSL
ncbi:glycosyltransferase [Synechococcus sp. 8F6]|uniref:glycosyltransferase n=1 Tax=Synechococcus sp. 8F6 TaxID=2025606 RepID=UPI00117CEFFF|nr:glycosyltransferase [Synechococcus sp. 8F6]